LTSQIKKEGAVHREEEKRQEEDAISRTELVYRGSGGV